MIGKFFKTLKKKNVSVYLFLLIPLSIYVVFFIIPNINALRYSFFKWDGIGPREFIGFKNYFNLFTNPIFNLTLKNTFLYTLFFVIGQNILGFCVALLIYKQSKIHNIIRTIVFLPVMLSTVAIGFTWGLIYDPIIGAINTFLKLIRLENLKTSWISDSKTALIAIVIMHIWAVVGYSLIMYIGGLQKIPVELYEAADIDGVNRFQKVKNITIPLMKSSFLTSLIFSTITGFIIFDYIYIMTGGGQDNSTRVLSLTLYQEGFQYFNMGYSAAISVIIIIIVMVFTVLQAQILKD